MRLFVIDYYKEGTWGAWEIPGYIRDHPGPWMSRHLPKFMHHGPMEVSNVAASWLLKIGSDFRVIRSHGTEMVNQIEKKVPRKIA